MAEDGKLNEALLGVWVPPNCRQGSTSPSLPTAIIVRLPKHAGAVGRYTPSGWRCITRL